MPGVHKALHLTAMERSGIAVDVSKYAAKPAIPDDKEVILVASDYGILPPDIIVEIIKV